MAIEENPCRNTCLEKDSDLILFGVYLLTRNEMVLDVILYQLSEEEQWSNQNVL